MKPLQKRFRFSAPKSAREIRAGLRGEVDRAGSIAKVAKRLGVHRDRLEQFLNEGPELNPALRKALKLHAVVSYVRIGEVRRDRTR